MYGQTLSKLLNKNISLFFLNGANLEVEVADFTLNVVVPTIYKLL